MSHPIERPFIPGLELSEIFFREAVRPLLEAYWPELAYSAARLDYGSDVMGFDTPQSMDHEWGPRLTLFLTREDHEKHQAQIIQSLSERLPVEIRDYPTNYGYNEDGTRAMQEVDSGPVDHLVALDTVSNFFSTYLNYDPSHPPGVVDWLSFPQQRLRTISSGRIYHDGLNVLRDIQESLHYYPRDLWLYLLAAQWRRISQEEAFVGRCGDVGDELGSHLIAARLVNDLMLLCFLIERQYTPYSKWFGTAFAQLTCADDLTPVFKRVLDAATWREREAALSQAYERLARMHNDLGITDLLPTQVTSYHGRPYQVIHADRFSDAIRNAISDPEVLRLPAHLGGIDQFVNSSDLLEHPKAIARLRPLFEHTVG
jgi:hypothetical protein